MSLDLDLDLDRSEPVQTLTVRMPCHADADDLRGVYELMARNQGGRPSTRHAYLGGPLRQGLGAAVIDGAALATIIIALRGAAA